jgi:predicted Fe-Mo cluster-binding NifX family protein
MGSTREESLNMRFAIPVADGRLAEHFGHTREFAFVVTDDTGAVLSVDREAPPPHEPGVLPAWLKSNAVDVVIAGGMGPRAVEHLRVSGIRVVLGAAAAPPEELVAAYHAGSLADGPNSCGHGEGEGHGGHGDGGGHGGHGGCHSG